MCADESRMEAADRAISTGKPMTEASKGLGLNSRAGQGRATVPDEDAPARPGLLERGFTSPAPAYKPAGGVTYLEAKGGGPARPPRTGPCAGMVVGRAASERMTAGAMDAFSGRTKGNVVPAAFAASEGELGRAT